MVYRSRKSKEKKRKVLFIDAADQVRTGRAQNFLDPEHIQTIYQWYQQFEDVKDHAKVVSIESIKENDYNLNIPLYVEKEVTDNLPSMEEALQALKESAQKAWEAEDRFRKLLTDFIEQ